jgi:lipopolysaccharide export system protein LptA
MKALVPFLAVAAAALPGPAAPAPASGQSSVLKGHNSNAPVDVSADRIEVQDRADRAIFSGNVVARQAEMTLTAARVTVAYANSGGVQIKRLDATGGVTVTSPGERASGDVGIYDLDQRIITLVGSVSLVRGDSRVKGGRLVIDLRSGRAVVDGGGPGSGGRVSGTFTVPQRHD